MKNRVCKACGHVGKPTKQCLGSFLVDAFIWGTVGSLALMSGLLPLLLVPVAWTLYHLAKFGTTKCPECGELEMVSMDSRKGREVLDPHRKVKVWHSSDEATV
jgi:ribosomal protein L32